MHRPTGKPQLSVVDRTPPPDIGDDHLLDLFTTTDIFADWMATTVTWGALADSFAAPDLVADDADPGRAKTAAGGYVLGRFFGNRRRRAELLDRCALTLDLDQAEPLEPLDAAGLLSLAVRALAGHAWLAHSTFSHTASRAKLRLVVPLSRAVDEDEFAYLTRSLAAKIGLERVDLSCTEAARLMYPPVAVAGGEAHLGYVSRRGRGAALDVDARLAAAPGWREHPERWPQTDEERRRGARIAAATRERRDPADDIGLAGAVNAAVTVNEALGKCGDVWDPVGGDEDSPDRRWRHRDGSGAAGGAASDGLGLFYSHYSDVAWGRRPMSAWEVLLAHATIGTEEGAGPLSPPVGWFAGLGERFGEGGVARSREAVQRLVTEAGRAPSTKVGAEIRAPEHGTPAEARAWEARVAAISLWVGSWPAVREEVDRRVREIGADPAWLAPGGCPPDPEGPGPAEARPRDLTHDVPAEVYHEGVGVGSETAGVAARADFLAAEEEARKRDAVEARRAAVFAAGLPWDEMEEALEALDAEEAAIVAGVGATPREALEERARAARGGSRGSQARDDDFSGDPATWVVGTGLETGGQTAFGGLLLRDRDGVVTSSAANVEHAIYLMPELARAVRFDTRSDQTVLVSDVPGDAVWPGVSVAGHAFGAPFESHHASAIGGLMTRKYTRSVKGEPRGPAFATPKILEMIDALARRHPFDPVVLYLRARTWDGERRLHRLLPEVLGVADTDYHRQVGVLLMRAAVRRALTPGCQWDHVPVLSGGEGIGKSSFCRELVPIEDWFGDHTPPVGGNTGPREIIEALSGKWIVEMAELTSTRQSEAEAVKSFITTRADKGRRAYAPREKSIPRQVVFIGTTNEVDYLKGFGTDRRFWPIDLTGTTRIDLERLRDWRPQLWAEAMALEAEGRPALVLTGAAATEVIAARDDVREDTSAEEARLEAYLAAPERPGDLEPGGHWEPVLAEGFAGADEGEPRDRVCEGQLVNLLEQRVDGLFPVGRPRLTVASRRAFVRRFMSRQEGWRRSAFRSRFGGYGRARVSWKRDEF